MKATLNMVQQKLLNQKNENEDIKKAMEEINADYNKSQQNNEALLKEIDALRASTINGTEDEKENEIAKLKHDKAALILDVEEIETENTRFKLALDEATAQRAATIQALEAEIEQLKLQSHNGNPQPHNQYKQC